MRKLILLSQKIGEIDSSSIPKDSKRLVKLILLRSKVSVFVSSFSENPQNDQKKLKRCRREIKSRGTFGEFCTTNRRFPVRTFGNLRKYQFHSWQSKYVHVLFSFKPCLRRERNFIRASSRSIILCSSVHI